MSSGCARPTTGSRSSRTRTAEPGAPAVRARHLAERHPAVVGAEGGGELVAADPGHAAGAVEPRPDDSGGGAALGDDDLLQPPVEVVAEPVVDLRPGELQRPGMQWAVVVVGVGNADQIGDGRAEEDVLDALGVTAGK